MLSSTIQPTEEFMSGSEDSIIAGILRVEEGNDRTNMVKVHKPSLGPYTSSNPKVCLDCDKLLDGVQIDEHCLAKK